MKNLTAAIVALYNTSNDFSAAIGTKFYNGFAPASTEYPYAVFEYPPSEPDMLFGGTIIEDVTWQLKIYSNDTNPEAILTLYEKAIALFDDAILTISGQTHLSMLRSMQYNVPVDIENEVRQWIIQYNIIMNN